MLKIRHRVIAEKVLNHLIAKNRTAEPIAQLLNSVCSRPDYGTQKRGSRSRRNIASLLNHEFLYRTCELQGAEHVYSQLEIILSNSYHYWLQRGSLQVEYGNIRHAENYINQAYSLEPKDYFVIVERSYMQLKLAYSDPHTQSAPDIANEAIENLLEIIDIRGKLDYYPYHVLGSQGLAWSRRAPITNDQRENLLRLLSDKVKEGTDSHPQSQELQRLKADIYKEFIKRR